MTPRRGGEAGPRPHPPAGRRQRPAGAFGQADPAEYGRLLRDKLLEEAAEAASAPGPAELLDELGDVLQVLYALAAEAGYSPAEIECARARTARSRGAFTRRVVWHDPLEREDTP